MDKLLEGFLAKTMNKTPEELSELLEQKAEDSEEVNLKENALDLLLEQDVQRVNNLKSSVKPDSNTLKEINDRAMSKVMDDFEKKLKARYSIESASKGLELVQEIIDQVSDCDISEDKIKQHPTFLDMEDRKNKELEALRKEQEEYMLNQDRRTRLSRVEQDVLGIFASLNPVESQNTVVANTRRNDFIKKFSAYDYEIKEDGDHFVMQDGKRVEDKHGNPINFKDFVKSVASLNYDFEQASGSNSGNTGSGQQQRVGIPKDEKEYFAKYAELRAQGKIEESIALNAAWNARPQ